jgi:uncharacterized membrane protein
MGNKRAGLLDEVRGFAIICMVVYHVMFVLKEFYDVNVPIFFEDWFDVIWAVFAGSFIFISGIVCRYSRNNIKRGAQCFLLGMILTFITAVAVPEVAIAFGILHFLGICMLLFGLGEKIADIFTPLVGITLCVLLTCLTCNIRGGVFGLPLSGLFFKLPRILYDANLLFPLGFTGQNFTSGDYFPLFPWVFVFFAGTYFGVYVKRGECPLWFYTTRVPFLAAAGRHTLWIYLLHQPIAMGILYLIFN